MKKQITLWLAVIMLFGTITTFAQKPFAGTITFETTAEGTDDPNVAAQLAELSEEVTIMGNNTKTAINQMGVGIIHITIQIHIMGIQVFGNDAGVLHLLWFLYLYQRKIEEL